MKRFCLAACVFLSGATPLFAISPVYSIGDPTPQEQLYLELINRARANPAAEGNRLAATTDPAVAAAYKYFGVNLTLLRSQFATLPAKPPLSFNPLLLAAARSHSQDMFAHAFQDHNGSDGSTPASRLQPYLAGATGYSWGENIFAYAQSAFYGHAGLEVDWGGTPATGGMQSPPYHRQNIHGDFREIGIGVVEGTNGSVGPQVVTEDFGSRSDTKPFLTGVVYRDLNGNGFYDAGEGIGGVSVVVKNATYSAVSASAGGYSVPVPGDGSYTVTFSGAGITPASQTVTVSGGANLKLDYALPVGPSPLRNVSTRARVEAGQNAMIGGFIINGTGSKKIVVRVLGPTLLHYGVTGILPDPTLELRDGSGALIASNDNWANAANQQAVSEAALAPSDPREPAILATLPPGSYTAVVHDAGGGSGIALTEVYDIDPTSSARLGNLSTRGLVQGNDGVMIAGMIIAGTSSQRVVVRALGPTLSKYGVTNSLADPALEVHDANGNLLAANDNWQSDQAAALTASGLAPPSSLEPAILMALPPGNYTAIVHGVNSASGVGLVELYALP